MARTVTARTAAWRRRQAGVTLVELLVAMVIMTVITTMIIGGWIALQSSYANSVNQNDARSSARYALNFASAEISTCEVSAVLPAPVGRQTSNLLRFRRNASRMSRMARSW